MSVTSTYTVSNTIIYQIYIQVTFGFQSESNSLQFLNEKEGLMIVKSPQKAVM